MTERTLAEIDGFIDMIHAACDNDEMNRIMRTLLSLPDPDRREMVRSLAGKLREDGAPLKLIEAVACLVSDDIAEKANDVIYDRGL